MPKVIAVNAKVTVNKTNRVHALVNQSVDYSISESDWVNAVVECNGNEDDALDVLKSNGAATHTEHNIEVIEILAEHEYTISVD
jgi:hypothetical protein